MQDSRGDKIVNVFYSSFVSFCPSRLTMVEPLSCAPVWKRLAAGFYDLLPLAALIMIGTALWMPISGGADNLMRQPLRILFQIFEILLISAYYIYSWFQGGQTIGMRAWKLHLQTNSGQPIKVRDATLRFIASLFSVFVLGLGILWAAFDSRRRMWHDILSGTMVIAKTNR